MFNAIINLFLSLQARPEELPSARISADTSSFLSAGCRRRKRLIQPTELRLLPCEHRVLTRASARACSGYIPSPRRFQIPEIRLSSPSDPSYLRRIRPDFENTVIYPCNRRCSKPGTRRNEATTIFADFIRVFQSAPNCTTS
ncbi:hypothetical protein KCP69_11030 [Salmonella enterica subsp. enterica]|nr:hypothetical protein KCP69_11030 [Salmonella enterica subsp. enterica]